MQLNMDNGSNGYMESFSDSWMVVSLSWLGSVRKQISIRSHERPYQRDRSQAQFSGTEVDHWVSHCADTLLPSIFIFCPIYSGRTTLFFLSFQPKQTTTPGKLIRNQLLQILPDMTTATTTSTHQDEFLIRNVSPHHQLLCSHSELNSITLTHPLPPSSSIESNSPHSILSLFLFLSINRQTPKN